MEIWYSGHEVILRDAPNGRIMPLGLLKIKIRHCREYIVDRDVGYRSRGEDRSVRRNVNIDQDI